MNEHTQDNDQANGEPAQTAQPSPNELVPGEGKSDRKFNLTWGFAIGLLGWFLINGMLWGISPGPEYDNGLFLVIANPFVCLPLNVGILLVLGWKKTTRPIAAGILAAMGLNFIISLILGLTLNAVCLLPFFIGGQL